MWTWQRQRRSLTYRLTCTDDPLQAADRETLVAYLESWGFACYGSETTDELREAAIENFDTEGA